MPSQVANNQFARLLGTIKQGHHLHVYIIDTVNAVFFAKSQQELESPGLVQPGLKILNANGPAEISWEGEVWYFGNAPSVQFHYSFE